MQRNRRSLRLMRRRYMSRRYEMIHPCEQGGSEHIVTAPRCPCLRPRSLLENMWDSIGQYRYRRRISNDLPTVMDQKHEVDPKSHFTLVRRQLYGRTTAHRILGGYK